VSDVDRVLRLALVAAVLALVWVVGHRPPQVYLLPDPPTLTPQTIAPAVPWEALP
jgi:hypothetical protein